MNNTGWDALALYAYGDKEFFGGWPGVTPTETVTIGGQSFQRFAMSGASGEALNLIFNDNKTNNIQLSDFAIIANRDYYLEITSEACKEIDKPSDESAE